VPNLTPPPATAVPQLKGIVQGVTNVVHDQAENKLRVNQEKSKAILDWHSFDIGEKAWTHFNQQGNTEWAALNRIYDKNPSQIFGKLTADGKVYLINQNGILFGPTAKVNVHSLVASSLNIADELVGGSSQRFRAEDFRDVGDDLVFRFVQDAEGNEVPLPGPVSNHAISSSDPAVGIHADEAGSVFFLAPQVENHGRIDAPSGQIGLVAARDAEIRVLTSGDRAFPYVLVHDFDQEKVPLQNPANGGMAVNGRSGIMSADNGIVGLYGRTLRQQGLIRSVTATQKNGTIELLAKEEVHLEAGSLTASPISQNPEKVDPSFRGRKSQIRVGGLGGTRELVGGEVRYVSEPTERIFHRGEIQAPSGEVELDARERVYLDQGSKIDVSGEWVAADAQENVVGLKLNSVELKNNQGQKDGVLQGQDIQVIGYEGSNIGDLSAALSSGRLSAREMNTTGGNLTVRASQGDIVMRKGAVIDISGGGELYSEGHYDGTMLLSGRRIYDIGQAPEWLRYDRIMGIHETVYERFGSRELYEGLFLGGSSPLSNFRSGHVEGHNAGSLTLEARGIVFNGTLIGSALAGLHQTDLQIREEQIDRFFLEMTQGKQEPRGGRLVMGVPDDVADDEEEFDHLLEEVVITSDKTLLPEDFGPEDDLNTVALYVSPFKDKDRSLFRTLISCETLNNSGVSDLSIYANAKVTLNQNVTLKLSPGGYLVDENADYRPEMQVRYDSLYGDSPASVFIWTGAFEQRGAINIPSGKVEILVRDTVGDHDHGGRIYLSRESRISVAGERINNLRAGRRGVLKRGHVHGGRIFFGDVTRSGAEVIIGRGADLDVSAGYELTLEGELKPGEAGFLSLEGSTLVLEGNLIGHALPGSRGGELQLQTTRLKVSRAESEVLPPDFTFHSGVPIGLKEHLVLGENQLDETGFSRITLKSFHDLEFEEGVRFSPSTVKLLPPGTEEADTIAGAPFANYLAVELEPEGNLRNRGLIKVTPEFAGESVVAASAGEIINDTQRALWDEWNRDGSPKYKPFKDRPSVVLSAGASIEVAPGGSIMLSGKGLMEMEGTLQAPAGEISIRSGQHNVVISRGARILAYGVNILGEQPLITGLSEEYIPLDGGTVMLEAKSGSVMVQEDSLIDVSGSKPVTSLMRDPSGLLTERKVAGAAGALELSFFDTLELGGEIRAQVKLPQAEGGLLTTTKVGAFVIDPVEVRRLQYEGFDAFTLRSLTSLEFLGSLSLTFGRRLTLDAPLINGLDGQEVHLSAPWITLANTREKYGEEEQQSYSNLVKDGEGAAGEFADSLENRAARLSLRGEWIDLKGSMALDGFGFVRIDAVQDMRVLDEKYNGPLNQEVVWKGQLRTTGDLTLQAARIYPAMAEFETSVGTIWMPSAFTFRSDKGKVTILPSIEQPSGPILSAGGSLVVEAPEIEHRGYLCAPMGHIALVGDAEIGTDKGLDTVIVKSGAGAVLLGEGSVTTTRGDVPIPYGILQDVNWRVPLKPRTLQVPLIEPKQFFSVTSAPDKSVLIQGNELTLHGGALVDSSGGGSLFAFEFQPGIEGLANPLLSNGRTVIVPGISLPGQGVFLAEGGALPEASYSVVPQAYAFLPRAYVIEDRGKARSLEKSFVTEEGYATIIGYETIAGTGLRSREYTRYAVRTAAEVLKEGEFKIAEITSGSAGKVSLTGTQVSLHGTVALTSLPMFRGGIIELTGKNMFVGTPGDGFQVDFQVSPSFFVGMDLEEIRIGDESFTETIRMNRARLQAPNVNLSAREAILMGKGAEIYGTDESVRLPDVPILYPYDPEVGLGAYRVLGIQELSESSGVSGILARKTAAELVPLEFRMEEGTFQWVGAAKDLLPIDFQLRESDIVFPTGTAGLSVEAGSITLNEGSLVHVSDEIVVDGQLDLRGGRLTADNSRIQLKGETVFFVPQTLYQDMEDRSSGLFLDEELWNSLNGFEELTLRSGTDLVFLGDFELAGKEKLVIDARRIIGLEPADFQTYYNPSGYDNQSMIHISGKTISFINTGEEHVGSTDAVTVYDNAGFGRTLPLNDVGEMTLEASSVLYVGPGDILINGFGEINLTSKNGDLVFRGKGALRALEGLGLNKSEDLALNLSAATGVTTASVLKDTHALAKEISGMDREGLERFISGNIYLGGIDPSDYGVLENLKNAVIAEIEKEELSVFEAADFSVNAYKGKVSILGGSSLQPISHQPGGSLKIKGRAIDHFGKIDVYAGRISLTATGVGDDDGVFLRAGSHVAAQGGFTHHEIAGETLLDFHKGGRVELVSGGGAVQIDAQAIIDVSNDTSMEADGLGSYAPDAQDVLYLQNTGAFDGGEVLLLAPQEGVRLNGTVQGFSRLGKGGSFAMDTNRIDDFSSLISKLATGGFNNGIAVRSRSGDIEMGSPLSAAQTLNVQAREFKMVADGGSILMNPNVEVDVSAESGGGRIELYANELLMLLDDGRPGGRGATIAARGTGTGAEGGEVILGTSEGYIVLQAGSILDVSGGEGGEGGTVRFQAPQSGSDVLLLPLGGSIRGASGVYVEAFKAYEFDGDKNITSADFGTSNTTGWWKDADLFMKNSGSIETRVLSAMNREGWGENQFHLLPGIEVRSSGSLTLSTDWTLASWRFDEEPGALTLRAAGDLVFNANLIDAPQGKGSLFIDSMSKTPRYDQEEEGWQLNLVAGSDLWSADPLSTEVGGGTLKIGSHLIYSQKGRIRFASGGDVEIDDGYAGDLMLNNEIAYNLATFTGDIYGYVKGSMMFEGTKGAVQSALGGIQIDIGDGLALNLVGGNAIRTTGVAEARVLPTGPVLTVYYDTAAGGGDITLNVGGDVIGGSRIPFFNDEHTHLKYWDTLYSNSVGEFSPWSADFGADTPMVNKEQRSATPTAGITTMAGGDITLYAGGDVRGQFGTFKEGNLTLVSGGDMAGLFQVADGAGRIQAMGSLERGFGNIESSLSLVDARVEVRVQGNIRLGTSFNPTFPDDYLYVEYYKIFPGVHTGHLTYGYGSNSLTALSLAALKGDVSISGALTTASSSLSTVGDSPFRVLPPMFEVLAGGDISIEKKEYSVAPAPEGSLRLLAGGDIGPANTSLAVRPMIIVSDLDPASVYGAQAERVGSLFEEQSRTDSHAIINGKTLHIDDPSPVEIRADGDIGEMRIFSPKSTEVVAGGTIRGLYLMAQNLRPDDLTLIRAKGDIVLGSDLEFIAERGLGDPNYVRSGYVFTGPGHFLVQAGNNLNLGLTQGIVTEGKGFNPFLDLSEEEDGGSSLMVVSGLFKEMESSQIRSFFEGLQVSGEKYTRLLQAGDLVGADELANDVERNRIKPLLEGALLGQGDIFMTSSQIATKGSSSWRERKTTEGDRTVYKESSDIYIVARGDINVGVTAIPDPTEAGAQTEGTGVFTAEGGNINIFSFGDLNVNESRVMTFRGGNILAWSHEGDVNAGRGAKSAINAEPPQVEAVRNDRGEIIGQILVFRPPAVGSGIRALTYDPDGIQGIQKAPALGDITIVAPKGVIDAGEAGIAGGNLFLGATQVLNAQNIEAAGVSLGMPVAGQGAIGLGSLSGVGSLTEMSKMTEQASSLASDRAEAAQQAAKVMEAFIPKWVDVKVIGFE
jgi:filamentous hemagglutinin family protein